MAGSARTAHGEGTLFRTQRKHTVSHRGEIKTANGTARPVSGEALGWIRQRSHGPRSSPRRSTHGSAPAPGHPDVPLDSRRGSDDDVGARGDGGAGG